MAEGAVVERERKGRERKDREDNNKHNVRDPRTTKCEICWRSNGAFKCAGNRVEFIKGYSQTRKLWVHPVSFKL